MKLAFREYGEGTPLIILHGLFGQSDNWNTLAKQFSEKGYHVYTLDLRNHGLSPHSKDWTYSYMAQDVKEFIDERELKNVVLMGHSMGGKVVMFFDKMFPNMASKVIICDIAAKEYPPHHSEVLQALHSVDFTIVKNRKEAEAEMNKHITDFGTKQFLLKNIYWKDTTNNIMDWRFNLEVISEKYESIREAVPFYHSSVPCLLIRGGNSNYINAEDQSDFSKRYSHIQFESIEGAGHWLHAEKPKEFFESVMGFLA
ncbi:MAG: alpha/beta fold hydrolase [Bacteroidota bacterium]|nr:alpha/beta fold hydrolase [Bacteroidota bacterium]